MMELNYFICLVSSMGSKSVASIFEISCLACNDDFMKYFYLISETIFC